MEPLSPDTPLEVERVWIAGLREKGPLWRLHCLANLTSVCWRAAYDAYQRAHPHASESERDFWLLQERYGNDIAQRVAALRHPREVVMPDNPELWDAVIPVIDMFETLAVPYCIGGSVASSFAGVARATLDVDLVADIRLQQAEPLATALTTDYYIDVEMIREAIRRRRSFNLIHLATMFKIAVFVMEDTPFAYENMRRRMVFDVPSIGRSLYFTSPEDIVLHKLLWYTMGGGVSDRQWYDLQGVLRLQAARLDRVYMQRWAQHLGLLDHLQRALEEAGLPSLPPVNGS